MTVTPAERHEIEDVLRVYATALDARDWTWLETVFSPDASAHFRGPGYEADESPVQCMLGGGTTRDEIIQSLKNIADSNIADSWQHHVTNQLVTLVDRSHATVQAMYFCIHVKAGAPGGDIGQWGGRYETDMVKTADGWRIQRLRGQVVWVFGNAKI
jgi:SnoaL-like domain